MKYLYYINPKTSELYLMYIQILAYEHCYIVEWKSNKKIIVGRKLEAFIKRNKLQALK